MGTEFGVVTESAEPVQSSRWGARLDNCGVAAMLLVTEETAFISRRRPGRSRNSQGRPSDLKLTSGSRRSGLSRGGGAFLPAGERRTSCSGGRAGFAD